MVTVQYMRLSAEKIRRDCIRRIPERERTISRIRFEFSERLTRVAGLAYMDGCIKLSVPLFKISNNFQKEFDNIVRHEIAHVLCPPAQVAGKQNRDVHGPAWRTIAIRLGGNGERCHKL